MLYLRILELIIFCVGTAYLLINAISKKKMSGISISNYAVIVTILEGFYFYCFFHKEFIIKSIFLEIYDVLMKIIS